MDTANGDPLAGRQPQETKPRRFLNRRRVLTYAAFLGGSAAVGLYTWRIEPHWLQIVERNLPIKGLPSPLVGKRMLQLSDLHVGPQVDVEYLAWAVTRASSIESDLIVLTGDFMTAHGTEQIDAVAQVLSRLRIPPLGIYAILGNHDYGRHWSDPKIADRLVSQLARLGIKTLRNECRSVEGLQLVGLDDLWGPNFNAEKAFAQVDWSGPTLTLCHNPDAVDRDDFRKCRGWVLAGHTHGGQCKPPFLAPPLLPVKNKRYTSGEFDVGEGRRLYINRGVGHLTRVRFNVRPEIAAFRLISG